MDSDQTYSAVGVRADSSRHLLSLKLSLDDANYRNRFLARVSRLLAGRPTTNLIVIRASLADKSYGRSLPQGSCVRERTSVSCAESSGITRTVEKMRFLKARRSPE
jgi:hypothetical protein